MNKTHGCTKMSSYLDYSLLYLIQKVFSLNSSFPKRTKIHKSNLVRRISLRIHAKASYTLEAAVIMPLVAGFFVALLFFFRVMQVETEVASALSYTSRNIAVEASTVESEAGLMASSELLLRKELLKCSNVKKYVSLKGNGVTLLGSKFDGSYIDLKASYFVKLPISFFGVKGINLSQNSCSRKWTGMNLGGDDLDPYVYYTDTGQVYHLTDCCPYLDLTIRSVKYREIEALRNKNGAKYSSCSRCVAKITAEDKVYITDYGTAYHTILNCSALKRTIHMVHLSEVGNRRLCSKCEGRD